MNGLFVAFLIGLLKDIRSRSYTSEQIEQIKREAAEREGGQTQLEAPKRPYRWWRYEGLF